MWVISVRIYGIRNKTGKKFNAQEQSSRHPISSHQRDVSTNHVASGKLYCILVREWGEKKDKKWLSIIMKTVLTSLTPCKYLKDPWNPQTYFENHSDGRGLHLLDWVIRSAPSEEMMFNSGSKWWEGTVVWMSKGRAFGWWKFIKSYIRIHVYIHKYDLIKHS